MQWLPVPDKLFALRTSWLLSGTIWRRSWGCSSSTLKTWRKRKLLCHRSWGRLKSCTSLSHWGRSSGESTRYWSDIILLSWEILFHYCIFLIIFHSRFIVYSELTVVWSYRRRCRMKYPAWRWRRNPVNSTAWSFRYVVGKCCVTVSVTVHVGMKHCKEDIALERSRNSFQDSREARWHGQLMSAEHHWRELWDKCLEKVVNYNEMLFC